VDMNNMRIIQNGIHNKGNYDFKYKNLRMQ